MTEQLQQPTNEIVEPKILQESKCNQYERADQRPDDGWAPNKAGEPNDGSDKHGRCNHRLTRNPTEIAGETIAEGNGVGGRRGNPGESQDDYAKRLRLGLHPGSAFPTSAASLQDAGQAFNGDDFAVSYPLRGEKNDGGKLK